MSAGKSLLQRVEDRIAAGDVALPTPNQLAARLQGITRDPDFDLQEVVALVSQDAVLTAEILRVANSSFYGGLTEIRTVRDAAVRLGAPELVRLTVLATQKGDYTVASSVLKPFVGPLWDHAAAVALGAGWLAKRLGFSDLQNEAFVAGLLHDIGGLVLVKALDEIAKDAEEPLRISESLFQEIYLAAHAKEGYALVESWDLPDVYAEVVRDHHAEDLADRGTLVNLVALADKVARRLAIGIESDPSLVPAAAEEAHTLGASDIMLAELAILLEDVAQGRRVPAV
ncbi:HDOD domain-containing protein [bacterium]|nr:HDOD domain-containing protein [bacterium]